MNNSNCTQAESRANTRQAPVGVFRRASKNIPEGLESGSPVRLVNEARAVFWRKGILIHTRRSRCDCGVGMKTKLLYDSKFFEKKN
jgi:hypothetical protein